MSPSSQWRRMTNPDDEKGNKPTVSTHKKLDVSERQKEMKLI